jgi:predicted nucleic acid-binding protein
MSLLIDTNVLSELARPRPDPGVLAWASDRSYFAVSAVTIEEIVFGLTHRPKPKFEVFLEEFLAAQCQVLPVSEAIARRAGELRGLLAKRGAIRTQSDMLIAATAQVHALTLVTRNGNDFTGCGIPVLNPFTA